ncbi:TPA: hypothetical protein PC537_003307 [Morganella morganii]|nr:hypothetical protein [Morganella morganii]
MNEDLYCIGVFENFTEDVFPTHVSPIIVSYEKNNYQRYIYKIENPYRIILIERVGKKSYDFHDLFPYPSYHIYDNPVKIKTNTQVIALDKNNYLLSSSKIVLIIKLLFYYLKRTHLFKRTLCCIKNVIH